MNINSQWLLTGAGDQVLRLTRMVGMGRRETVSPVLTVRDVCRRLHKSRRQVYRYLTAGRLTPCARILGQWLFPESAIAQCARPGLPRFLKPLLWDVTLSSVDTTQHREFILARVLEYGDRAAVRWAFHTYPREAVTTFLQGRGRDLLSDRTWQFWALLLRLRGRGGVRPSWRAPGRRWGGVA